MSTISRKEVLNLYCRFIKDKTKDDICWFFKGIDDKDKVHLSAVKIPILYELMKRWRECAKHGYIFTKKVDCGSATSFDGIEWHYLVLQRKKTIERDEEALDPFGYFLFDRTIYGEMLFFKHKSNRDKVQEYLMRRLES